MNLSSLFGFLVAAGVVYFGVIGPSAKPEIFLDPHAIILVLGGTLAAALIAFPAARLVGLFRMLIYGVIFKEKSDHQHLVHEMVTAAAMAKENLQHLKLRRPGHPFLEEGYHLISENVLNTEQLEEVLRLRSDYFKKNYLADAKMLNALSKFPPAFGLLGASTGMIAMMTNLGHGGADAIGPAMAVALVATFWGIALANFVLLPLSDYATKSALDDSNTRNLIIDGLMMVKRAEPPGNLAAKLNGYLSIESRLKLVSRPAMSVRSTDDKIKKIA